MPISYKLQFEAFFRPDDRASWRGVFHGTNEGSFRLGACGGRSPGVWVSPASVLHICSCVNGKSNHCYETSTLNVNEWTLIEIGQELVNGIYNYFIVQGSKQTYEFHTILYKNLR